MAGSIIEGEIQRGLFVRVAGNSQTGVRLQIDSIEFVRRDGGEDVCLCIWSGSRFAEMLRGMEMSGETLEVAASRDYVRLEA